MIKIRYSDLPTGLHVRADAQGRHIVIYLLPGLTPAQRRAALRRVRSGSRMGRGPRLPAAGFACAVMADRLRVTLGNGVSAMRAHPVLLVPPLIVFTTLALTFILVSSVSIRYQPGAVSPSRPLVPVAPGQVGTRLVGIPGPRPGDAAAPGTPAPGTGSRSHASGPGSSPSPGPSPSPSASPTPGPGGPSPQPNQPAPGPSSPGSSPAPSPSPPDSGSGGNGGVCLDIGPLGVCLL